MVTGYAVLFNSLYGHCWLSSIIIVLFKVSRFLLLTFASSFNSFPNLPHRILHLHFPSPSSIIRNKNQNNSD